MICILIGLGLMFIAFGFCLTKNNARYILSGINTMNQDERKNLDLKSYIPHFRRFHIFMGILLLVIGVVLNYTVNERASGIFLGAFAILYRALYTRV